MKKIPVFESEVTLKTLREINDITQEELAKRLGTRKQVISLWETRSKVPRLDNAVMLAKELKVSLKVLCRSLGIDTAGIPDDSPN
jgi:transcriptional regulator with XRE-family HTH domain